MRIYKPNEEIPIRDYIARKLKVIKNEIKSLSNDYILNVNQEEYINMLVSKHTISFEIYYATEQLIRERIIEKQEHFDEWLGYYGGGRLHTYTEHQFCLKYKFSGDIDVLRIEPESFSSSTLYNPIPIDVLGDEIQIRFSAREIDAVKIKKQIEEIKRNEFGNLDNERGAQWHISQYNARLPQEIKTIFRGYL